MISPADIVAWSDQAPWPLTDQVEQDLVLTRLMIEIANHPRDLDPRNAANAKRRN